MTIQKSSGLPGNHIPNNDCRAGIPVTASNIGSVPSGLTRPSQQYRLFSPDYPNPVGSIGCFLRTTRTQPAVSAVFSGLPGSGLPCIPLDDKEVTVLPYTPKGCESAAFRHFDPPLVMSNAPSVMSSLSRHLHYPPPNHSREICPSSRASPRDLLVI